MKKNLLILGLSTCLPLAAVAAVTPVTPPPTPSTSPLVKGEALAALPKLAQSPELAASLKAVAEGPLPQRLAALKRKAVADLVFVEGGSFEMGDWGPYIAKADSRPVHTVQLTGFYISRYKTTYAEFDTYTDASRTPRTADSEFERNHRHPLLPAGAVWQRARDYCQWLGQQTGLPFDLPTEAQWEYAARSRGQRFVFPTDNGDIDHGRNVPGSSEHMKLLSPLVEDESRFVMDSRPYPVGLFPPTPLGLYDMAHDGQEWTLDWYAADYYAHSPKVDPKGPASGDKKVVRAWPVSEDTGFSGISAYRRARDPLLRRPDFDDATKLVPGVMISYGLRCVVNSDRPLPGVKR